VGPRAVLDAVVKRKIPSPHRESNPRTPWKMKDILKIIAAKHGKSARTVSEEA
jgi:hypothetical protein